MCFGGSRGGDGGAAEARRREQERQARISQGTESINNAFSQFNDDFFGGIRQSGIDYYQPTLQRDYRDARERLVYNLANSGLLQSSEGARQFGRLNDLFDQASQQAESSATEAANRVRQNVETSRTNLFNTLNASADPAAAASLATQQADLLTQPVTFAALPNLFSGFLQDLTARAQANPSRAARALQGVQLYNTGSPTGTSLTG